MPWRYAFAFAKEWSLIALAMIAASVWPEWYVIVPAVIVVGTRQHALGLLGHDGVHRLINRRRWLNDLMTNALVYWPIATCGSAYRHFHLTHHRHTRDEFDPELSLVHGWLYKIPAPRLKFALMLVTDLLGLGSIGMLQFQRALRPRGAWNVFRLILFWAVIIAMSVASGTWLPLAIWFVAIITVLSAVHRIRTWSEHQGVEGTLRFQPSTLSTLLFYPYNTWCHYEHHIWPNISCFNLPKARAYDSTANVLTEAELYGFFGGKFDLVKGVKLSREVEASLRPAAVEVD